MTLRVLTWNLMHGRSLPGAGRDLFDDFADAIEAWEWDVALLQEAPPWWPAPLAQRTGAQPLSVLTSRNFGRPLRQALAVRWPDLMRSGGGGANAILVRGREVLEHRRLRLTWWPERRWMHAVRLAAGCGWVGNLHATAHHERRARDEARAAEAALLDWAAGEPVVLGGDFNVRGLGLEQLVPVASLDVDYVFAAAGWRAGGSAVVPERGTLSDHAPLVVTLA